MQIRADRRYLYRFSRSGEEGLALFVVLFSLLLLFMIGIGFGFALYIEQDINRNYYKSVRSLYVAESGISEALGRLTRDPVGTITVNGKTFNPSINIDPQILLGDGVDNDMDGIMDCGEDPDELNAKWDWHAFILLNNNDPQTVAGADGDTLILPTIMPSDNWVERNWDMDTSTFHTYNTVLAYTHSPNPIDPVALKTDPDVLKIRFLLEGDLDLDGDGLPDNADLDGDGTSNEIVFYDIGLPSNGLDDQNTLFGREDTINDNESSLNINWGSPGTVTNIPASGDPVIVISATGRYGDSQKRLEVWASGKPLICPGDCGICACTEADLSDDLIIDSYDSGVGPWDPVTNAGNAGDVCSNGSVTVFAGRVDIRGSIIAGADITTSDNSHVVGDVFLGGTITVAGTAIIEGTVTENIDPDPQPCDCDEISVDEVVGDHQIANDNSSIPPNPWRGPNNPSSNPTYNPGPYHLKLQGSDYIIFSPGDYYFDTVELSGTSKIVLGHDDNSDGVVDSGLADGELVTFYVSGKIILGDDAEIIGDGIDPPNPANFKIISSAQAPIDEILISGTFDFYGFIYAPLTTVDIQADSVYYGGVLSNVFKGQDRVFFHFDASLKDNNQSSGFKMFSWDKD